MKKIRKIDRKYAFAYVVGTKIIFVLQISLSLFRSISISYLNVASAMMNCLTNVTQVLQIKNRLYL